MSLHFSRGRLLLKNTTNNLWYYLYAEIGVDSLPHIRVEQTVAGDFSLSDYDEYVILRADNGDLYKLDLATNGSGVIDYQFNPATLPVTQRPVRIFLKDSNSILYSLKALEDSDNGNVYLNVLAYSSSGNRTINKACFCPVSPSVNSPRTFAPAEVLEECTITFPPIIVPVESEAEGILDEGGVEILDEGGEVILEG